MQGVGKGMKVEAARRIQVLVKREPGTEDLPLPRYMTAGSAGMDLLAAVPEPVVLASGERAMVPSGISIALPVGYEAQVRPRSGLAARHGISLLNAPGTIDSDYRGEVCMILINLGSEPFTVSRGDRVAQMIIAPVVQAEWEERAELPETRRSSGGFGHTGR